MSRPRKAPTSGPPEVLLPHGTQGFGNLHEDRPGLGETPYATMVSSLCTNGSYFLNTQVGRASNARGFTSTFRTLPNILCGLQKQAHNLLNKILNTFLDIKNHSLRTSNTKLYTTPDNYNTHIYNLKYLPDESHNSSY